jgi:hypothetical protein
MSLKSAIKGMLTIAAFGVLLRPLSPKHFTRMRRADRDSGFLKHKLIVTGTVAGR